MSFDSTLFIHLLQSGLCPGAQTQSHSPGGWGGGGLGSGKIGQEGEIKQGGGAGRGGKNRHLHLKYVNTLLESDVEQNKVMTEEPVPAEPPGSHYLEM